MDNLNGFCGSPFWDSNLTWYTENPALTPCFEQTVLVWTPCIFLWVFLPFEIYNIASSKFADIPWNWRNITKIIINGTLIVICFFEFIYSLFNIKNHSEMYPVKIYTPVIKMISLTLSFVLTFYHRKKGQQSSGFLFFFWLLLSILGIPQFCTSMHEILNKDSSEPYPFLISYIVYYCLSVIMLVLNLFADLEPEISGSPKVDKPCPEISASFLSKITFSWFDGIAFLGFKKPLKISDLFDLNYEDMAFYVVHKFYKYWSSSSKHSKETGEAKKNLNMKKTSNEQKSDKEKREFISIIPALCKVFGKLFLIGSLYGLISDILQYTGPEILGLLITFVNGDEPQWRGYIYASTLFIIGISQGLLMEQNYHKMYQVGLRIRTSMVSAIYRKALKLSNSSKRDSTVGEIVNLMAVDAESFLQLPVYLYGICSAILQIVFAIYLVWRELGVSVSAGLCVFIVLLPLNVYIIDKLQNYRIKQMKKKDERVKLMNEILSGIKVLKLYAWEPSFKNVIMNVRKEEMDLLKKSAFLNACIAVIWTCTPFLVIIASFTAYILSDESNILDARKAFVTLSIFNILRFPLLQLPRSISSIIKASVSIKRINKFMNYEELNPDDITHDESEEPIKMENCSFTWGGEDGKVLHDINLKVSQGSLVTIIGSVGAGKSSLLSALLGEMEKLSGSLYRKGEIAYVPQVAWIQNASLKDNILFGNEFDEEKYKAVIAACALEQDIDMLPTGDQTEIGEKGINLSGGQKQRVSLARAVYYGADLYLFDDPLSAVDSHVGKHIFENVLGPNGILKNKTRMLVTHSITFLSEVDFIIVLKDGRISEIGTYNELKEKKSSFQDFLLQCLNKKTSSNEGSTDMEIDSDLDSFRTNFEDNLSDGDQLNKNIDKNSPGKLIEEERVETGLVKWDVYHHYIKAAGINLTIATIVSNIIYQCFSIGSNTWLSIWTSDTTITVNGTQDRTKIDLYLGVYGGIGFGQNFAIFFSELIPLIACWFASKFLHNMLLDSVLHAPLLFTDTTPLGRILSRFSRDVEIIDSTLSKEISDGIFCFFDVISVLVVISYTTPIFIAAVVPMAIINYFIQRFYTSTSRQLKRLESSSRSPIFSHFGETISGTPVIRAFGEQERFTQEFDKKVDFHMICYYPGMVALRWLEVRLEILSNFVVFFSALLAVLAKDSISPGLVGLSVSYALQVAKSLNWFVQMSSNIETDIVAAERIKEYEDLLPEAPWEISPNITESDWPRTGEVEFRDLKLRYREGLDLVLKGLTFKILSEEKIGIVGRTGAGKSSLTLGLFRIIEAASGSILIDGIDISKLGLHVLRSRLTIIPQDPVLFSGTVRMNLDPFEKYTDDQLWCVLEKAHLKPVIQSLAGGLLSEVCEGGENFSVGQRQLICLTRALLRKTKVLVLDEATAAIDLETDKLIQMTIRSQFSFCTVFTIAHRLDTIMDSDRVMVLDKGYLKEFDSPGKLLADKESIFYGMACDAGLI